MGDSHAPPTTRGPGVASRPSLNVPRECCVNSNGGNGGTHNVRRKDGGRYQQPVMPDAVDALRAWLAVRPACPAPYVFTPLPPARRAGPPPSDGRTGDDAVLPRGRYIQDSMRHKNPRTTRVYARVDAETLREVARPELRFPQTPRQGRKP